ncbi:MAG: TolC family protein [Armatimonadota bacterium]
MACSRRLILLVLMSALFLRVLAQDALTLDAAVRAALANHPARKAADADTTAASANLRGAKALSNPEIVVAPGILGPAGSDELLSIAQPLEINGTRTARTQIAAGQLAAIQAQTRIVERELALAVRTAYWELAQAQAIAGLDAENVQHAEALAAAAKKSVELGNEPLSHQIKAEVELARTRQQLIRSQAAVTHAVAALNTAMGREPATSTVLADALTAPAVTFDEAALLPLALAERPEMAAAHAEVHAAQGEVAAARAARRPDLAVQVRQEEWNGAGGVGLGISLPLIDWGSAKAERQRAQATVAAQQQRVEAVQLAIRQEVATAVTAVRSAEAQLHEFREQVLGPAQQLAEMAMLGYQEGAMTYLEVLEARRTLRAVNADYFATLGEYHKALAQLMWAAGVETLPAPVTEGNR